MLVEMYLMEFYLADPRDDLSGMDVARKVQYTPIEHYLYLIICAIISPIVQVFSVLCPECPKTEVFLNAILDNKILV